jgi:tetratricopeptide (TPR) repeat protein
MTGRTNIVSSTKPITSGNAAIRVALALAIAALAIWMGYGAVRGLLGARAQAAAEETIERAVALPRGAQRDEQLAAAQSLLMGAVDLAPEDADLWNMLAETNLLQATTAAMTTVSNDLLESAVKESERAVALAPQDPAAPARIALVRSLQGDRKADAAAALSQSYAARAFDRALGLRRLETAGRTWANLDGKVRASTLAEACELVRGGDRERVYDVRLGDAEPAMALALDQVMSDPRCGRQG